MSGKELRLSPEQEVGVQVVNCVELARELCPEGSYLKVVDRTHDRNCNRLSIVRLQTKRPEFQLTYSASLHNRVKAVVGVDGVESMLSMSGHFGEPIEIAQPVLKVHELLDGLHQAKSDETSNWRLSVELPDIHEYHIRKRHDQHRWAFGAATIKVVEGQWVDEVSADKKYL